MNNYYGRQNETIYIRVINKVLNENISREIPYNIQNIDKIDPTVTFTPIADVIEREKIDKAIEEIQKLRGCSCSCSDGIIDDVEDILDKLIESGE